MRRRRFLMLFITGQPFDAHLRLNISLSWPLYLSFSLPHFLSLSPSLSLSLPLSVSLSLSLSPSFCISLSLSLSRSIPDDWIELTCNVLQALDPNLGFGRPMIGEAKSLGGNSMVRTLLICPILPWSFLLYSTLLSFAPLCCFIQWYFVISA